jgi:hypothetical protein
MGKKILGIVGSYRKERVIDTAVSEILRGAESRGAETEKIYLIDKRIEFCTNCRTCTQQKDAGRRGRCVHDDEMDEILAKVDEAEGIVLGSPANFFNATAVTRRFIERLLPYAYWPWGGKMPRPRSKEATKRAVVVTSSACPAFLARILVRGPLSALKTAAKCVGAKVDRSLYFGPVALKEDSTLDADSLRKAYAAGEKLAE